MKKHTIILVLLITFFSFVGYKFIKLIEDIETPDLEYNTIYSKKYKEENFNNSLLGKTKNEIIERLGIPLETNKFNSTYKFLYKNKKDSINIDCSPGVNTSIFDKQNLSFVVFEFDKNDNVKNVFKVVNSQKVTSDSLIGISKKEIIKKFGIPNQSAQIGFNITILSFSNLKKGPYTGKKPMIHIRNIAFDEDGKAIKIIKSDGYDFSEGICEINNNEYN